MTWKVLFPLFPFMIKILLLVSYPPHFGRYEILRLFSEKNDQIYHDFLTNPRKASFEGEVGKEVELHGTDNDTNDEGLLLFDKILEFFGWRIGQKCIKIVPESYWTILLSNPFSDEFWGYSFNRHILDINFSNLKNPCKAGFGGSASSLLCDPEHDMIISKNGKIRKGTKTTSALRGLDQSTIFRDSPRSTQRKSKVNAFNGLSAHHYE